MERRENIKARKADKSALSSVLGNWVVRNLLLAVAVVAALMLAATVGLSILTQHNRQTPVPDFTGQNLQEASRIAANSGVRTDVVDSIYVKRMPRGSVVRQEPKAGALVKNGRRIQLTINAVEPKKIPMPNLVGYSLRSAKAEIRSRGLELGRLLYVQDIATNNVLRQIYRGSEIPSGRLLPSESVIDLVLGLNPVENLTSVPNVKGLRRISAVDAILENSLNVGRSIYDKSVKTYQDSLNAVVYCQDPDPVGGSITMGRSVKLYLTIDENKIASEAE